MIVPGQLFMIERTRFPYGGCTVMTLGSQEGLAESGDDRLWHVMLTQCDAMTRDVPRWPATVSLARQRFVTVLEVYLKPVRACHVTLLEQHEVR